ncbi:MAG: hypothetical protein HUK25_09580 [Treponema sp.]|nr:hypothetical protein [Treponema sp.]
MITRLHKNEYDSYVMKIPLKFLFGRKRNKYIYGELEKRHPCFSDAFVFDSKFSIGKNGILSNVVVMERARVSYLKYSNGKRILCTEKGRILFENAKINTLVLSVILLLFLICSVFVLPHKRKVVDVIDEGNFITETVQPEKEEIYKNQINDFFADLKKCEGILESFQWNTDGYTETISASLSNCSPYQFDFSNAVNTSLSEISYENEVSRFSFSNTYKGKIVCSVSKSEKEKESFSTQLKQILQENGFILLKESVEPLSFSFFGNSINIKCLEPLCSDSGYFIKEFRYEAGKDSFVVSFTDSFENESVKELISLFSKSRKKILDKNLDVKVHENKTSKIDEEKTETKLIDGKKIGVIKKNGGESHVYYKNQKGRIVNEKMD